MGQYGTVMAVGALAFLALGSAARADGDGETIFKRSCGICHSVMSGQNRVGPTLAGVVGRKGGTVEAYTYSSAMKDAGQVWDEAALDQFIENPRAFIAGTKMAFIGLKNPDERKAVIDFLKAAKP